MRLLKRRIVNDVELTVNNMIIANSNTGSQDTKLSKSGGRLPKSVGYKKAIATAPNCFLLKSNVKPPSRRLRNL